nr:hypothetical protein [Novosphingobium panipatense]
MMHMQITPGLPQDVASELLEARNCLDVLRTQIDDASELMWMLSGNDDLSSAQRQTFRALERLTKALSADAESVADKLEGIAKRP